MSCTASLESRLSSLLTEPSVNLPTANSTRTCLPAATWRISESSFQLSHSRALPLALIRSEPSKVSQSRARISPRAQAADSSSNGPATSGSLTGLPGLGQLLSATLGDAKPVSIDEARTGCTNDFCYGVGHILLGIDIGGTTIKAAPVDTITGELLTERHVIETPQPATPEAVADVIKQMLDHFEWKGAVGVGIPAVVRSGVVCTAANIDQRWIGTNAEQLFYEHSGVQMAVVNDADAAGYAEMAYGAGSGSERTKGMVMMITFGTGIGTAMFVDGILVPNLELGHLELDGVECEKAAAGVLVKQNCWSWQQWAEKVQWYLSYLERLMWPNLFIIGGGVSNAHEEWLHKVELPNKTPIKVASMKNDAGIIGAALAALAKAAYEATQKPQQVSEVVNA